MLTLRPGSLAYRLISMLSVTGEYPIHSLHLLGNPRVMRDLVRRMSEPQLVRLPGADSVQTKLVQISGKGAAKSVRLYKGYGAGAGVTAGGGFADIMSIANVFVLEPSLSRRCCA